MNGEKKRTKQEKTFVLFVLTIAKSNTLAKNLRECEANESFFVMLKFVVFGKACGGSLASLSTFPHPKLQVRLR